MFTTLSCRGCGREIRVFQLGRKEPREFCSKPCSETFKNRKKRSKRKKQRFIEAGFYQAREWLHVRYLAILRSDGCCEACGRGKRHKVSLHVDHVKPRSKYPELALELNNLQVLCADCNLGKSNIDQTDWRTKKVSTTAPLLSN